MRHACSLGPYVLLAPAFTALAAFLSARMGFAALADQLDQYHLLIASLLELAVFYLHHRRPHHAAVLPAAAEQAPKPRQATRARLTAPGASRSRSRTRRQSRARPRAR